MQLDLDAPPRMSLRREEWCAWCIAKNGVPGVPGASREAPAALLEAAGLTPKPAEAYPRRHICRRRGARVVAAQGGRSRRREALSTVYVLLQKSTDFLQVPTACCSCR